MSVMTITQLEENISLLSREEQFLLLEKIVHRLRKKEAVKEKTIESQLADMASDPQIQMELKEIEKDFAATEFDGLENY